MVAATQIACCDAIGLPWKLVHGGFTEGSIAIAKKHHNAAGLPTLAKSKFVRHGDVQDSILIEVGCSHRGGLDAYHVRSRTTEVTRSVPQVDSQSAVTRAAIFDDREIQVV